MVRKMVKKNGEMPKRIIIALSLAAIVMLIFYEPIAATFAIIAFWIGLGLAIGLSIAGLALALWIMTWIVEKVQNILRVHAETRLVNAEVAIKVKESRTLVVGDAVFKFDDNMSNTEALHLDPRTRHNGISTEATEFEKQAWALFILRGQARSMDGNPISNPVAQIEMPDLLSTALKFDRVMLIGGSGSGKTTFMQHMVANKEGDVIVCDPDDDQDTWPDNALVVGGGEDFDAIEVELSSFVGEKSRRYQDRAQGKKDFSLLYLVLDEWYKTLQHIEGGKYLKEMLVSLRKVNMGVLVISQSDRAQAIGLSGNFDLMSSFEAVVRLSGVPETGISATIDTGTGPIIVTHPGPFDSGPRLPQGPSRPYELVEPAFSSGDSEVVRLFKEGKKPWEIGEITSGQRGGWQTKQVEEVLRRNKLIS
jgi:energy-coupling factor transporter ATP-binding protein EcfA2